MSEEASPPKRGHGPLHLASSTLVHSGAITHAVKGCFRLPGQLDVLVARDTSVQLCSPDFRSCSQIQPLFVPILSLQTFTWSQMPGWSSTAQEDVGKDSVLFLSATGTVVFLKYSTQLKRFISASGCLRMPGGWSTRLHLASLYPTSPFLVAASPTQTLILPVDLPKQGGGAPWVTEGRMVCIGTRPFNDVTITAVCQLPCARGQGGSHHPIVAVLSHPVRDTTTLPLLAVYSGDFTADGKVGRSGYVRLAVFSFSLFSFSFRSAGWPLDISAIPPGNRRCQGLVVMREEGLSVLTMKQLLGGEDIVSETQTAAGLPEGVGAYTWVDDNGWPCLLMSRGYGNDALLCLVTLQDAEEMGAPWWCINKLMADGVPERALPNPASCLLLVAPDCLFLSLHSGCPIRLCPAAGGGTVVATLTWQRDFGDPEAPRLPVDWLQEGRRVRWGRLAGEQLDWGGGPLYDLLTQPADTPGPLRQAGRVPPVKCSRRAEIVAACGDGYNASLAFLQRLAGATVEAQGPRQEAVTGMWSVLQQPGQPWHSLVLVSFADASRALTAGQSMVDVSDGIGICQTEATLHCDSICEGAVVQITRSQARCCSIADLPASGEADDAGWSKRRSPHSTRKRGEARLAPVWGAHRGEAEMMEPEPGRRRSLDDSHAPGPERVWTPPPGSSIGAAACVGGLLFLHHGAGSWARLVCLRCEEPPGGCKRKRGVVEVPGLAPAGSTDLPGEASCIAATRYHSGGHLLAVGLRGPSIQLLHVQHFLHGAAHFQLLASFPCQELHRSLQTAGLSPDEAIGSEPAECLQFLPSRHSSPSSFRKDEDYGNLQLLASWRSGNVLHLELSGGALGSGGQQPQVTARGLWCLGHTPVSLRELPGTQPSFLALGTHGLLLEYDAEDARLTSKRLDLRGASHLAPMYVKSGDNRCLRLLAVAASQPYDRLEIRRFREQTHWLSGANVETRPLAPGTPRALLRLPARDSLLVVCPRQLQLLSAGGRGSVVEATLPYGEQATCAAVWRPEQPGSYSNGGSEGPELLLVDETSEEEEGNAAVPEEEAREQPMEAEAPERAREPPGEAAEGAASSQKEEASEAGKGTEAEAAQQQLEPQLQQEMGRLAGLDLGPPPETCVLEEELVVVGTGRKDWSNARDPRLESKRVACSRDRTPLCQTYGRLLLLHFGAGSGNLIIGQEPLPGAVQALCTAALRGSTQQLLLAITGSRLMAYMGSELEAINSDTEASSPGPKLELLPLLNKRMDRIPCQMRSATARGLVIADQEQGATMFSVSSLGRRIQVELTATLARRCSATSACYAGFPQEGKEKPSGGLLLADEEGMLVVVGNVPATGYTRAVAHEERAAASFGCPLVSVNGGLEQSEESEAERSMPEYTAGTSMGHVIRLQHVPAAKVPLLQALEASMGSNPATRPVTGESHLQLRRGSSHVERDGVIMDGDLLLEYLSLPRALQAEIACQAGTCLGKEVKPLAVEVLLRGMFESCPSDE